LAAAAALGAGVLALGGRAGRRAARPIAPARAARWGARDRGQQARSSPPSLATPRQPATRLAITGLRGAVVRPLPAPARGRVELRPSDRRTLVAHPTSLHHERVPRPPRGRAACRLRLGSLRPGPQGLARQRAAGRTSRGTRRPSPPERAVSDPERVGVGRWARRKGEVHRWDLVNSVSRSISSDSRARRVPLPRRQPPLARRTPPTPRRFTYLAIRSPCPSHISRYHPDGWRIANQQNVCRTGASSVVPP
jgi:hypothetical protein